MERTILVKIDCEDETCSGCDFLGEYKDTCEIFWDDIRAHQRLPECIQGVKAYRDMASKLENLEDTFIGLKDE